MKQSPNTRRSLTLALAFTLLGLTATSTQAIEISNGELTGSFDTTISYGASWRLSDYDEENVGKAANNPLTWALDNAGQRAQVGRWSVNGDDGNLNYPDGGDLISHTIKFNSELDLRWRNYGGFTRFTGFYDFENADADFLSDEAQERVGKDFRLLDLYVYGDHDFNGRFLQWRLGRQVVSWGESSFIQGGMAVISPVDVSALRLAGSELKDAFEGVNMIKASMDLTPSLSLEALYMFEFRHIKPDPAGAFFSTNDLATPGGSYAMLSFGTVAQPVINPDLYDQVCMQGNIGASDSLLPDFLIGLGCQVSFPREETRYAKDSGQYGAALRYFAEGMGGTEFGFYYLNYHSRLPLISGRAVTTSALNSGRYWTEYPEDIHLWGVSFNTNVGTWSLAGEVTYRPNAPLQIDDVEVLFAGLTPLNPLIPAEVNRFKSQLGEFAPGEEIRGWNRHKSWQAQSTLGKLFGPNNPFRASQIAFGAEIGFNYVSDLPDQDFLRYNAPGTDSGGGADYLTGDFRNPETELTPFADDFSWGYRLITRFDYYNAIGAMTVSPRIAWEHDVSGTTPGPGGSFIDGRKRVTVGLGFNYLQEWIFDLAYTAYFGAGNANQLQDRDFIAASVRYSF
jgi:hypothetical protein